MNSDYSKTSICFVANFTKTYFFHEIGLILRNQGVNVCWVVTKVEQYEFLRKSYGDDAVVYVNRTFINKPNDAVDDFRLNELVYGDRVFKYDMGNGLKFLQNIQKPIYELLKKHNTSLVVGEMTWSHELLVKRICEKRKELNCIYLECSLVRIPNNRFAFFTDESQCNMLQFDEPVTNEVIQVVKPSYLKINDKILKKNNSIKGRLMRVKRFFTGENIEKNDPNVIVDTALRFQISSREEYNKISYKRIPTVDFETVENEKFIFIGFQKQPESTIDVYGRYYENQMINIVNLWRMLPFGWKILVKEHTNAIGDRSYNFYQELLSYPNILLIKETTDSRRVIEKCQLVVTVSGTMAYEAALMKVPAITFSKVYFNRINFCRHITLDELTSYDNLTSLINEIKQSSDNRLEYSNYLMKNSFDGYITDYLTDASVMEKSNLELVSKGFFKLLDKYGFKSN